jgi:hypothetical protein
VYHEFRPILTNLVNTTIEVRHAVYEEVSEKIVDVLLVLHLVKGIDDTATFTLDLPLLCDQGIAYLLELTPGSGNLQLSSFDKVNSRLDLLSIGGVGLDSLQAVRFSFVRA